MVLYVPFVLLGHANPLPLKDFNEISDLKNKWCPEEETRIGLL
jgi:hypothetical protein